MAETLNERGFFWWFNEPSLSARSKEASVPGLLTITDNGQITLETDGSLCMAGEYEDWSRPRTLPASRRIAGLLARGGEYVLLEGLERTDLSLPEESPQQQQFDAQVCSRRGRSFPETYEEANFVELRIELAGFEDWLKLDSIVVEREYSEGNQVNVRVSYKEWKLECPTTGGVLCVESITTGAPLFMLDLPRREAQFSQRYCLVFRPDAPSEASSLRHIFTKLEELLTLLTGTYHRFAWPILVSKEEPFDEWNTICFSRGTQSAQPVNPYSIWVHFGDIRDRLGDLFRDWLTGSELFGAGYYLYVSSLRNPHVYTEDRFVNLVWAVEALHRRWLGDSETSERVAEEKKRVESILSSFPEGGEDRKWLRKRLKHAHEPSLEERTLQCLRKLPFTFGKGELENFAKACANRRNDISHAGGPRENTDYSSFHLEISRLANALDHLFHALLLHQIGVDTEVIFKVMTDSIVSHQIKAALTDVGLSIQAAP